MKKILIIHTNYQNLGGEDTAVISEQNFLSQYYDVRTLRFQNNVDSIYKQAIYFLTNNNKESMKILQEEIDNFNPDIAYVHNTWFKASIGIFKILNQNNIKTFLKLHNFRYHCTKSFFSSNHLSNSKLISKNLDTDNIFCLACGSSKKSLGFFNKYYSDSYIKSFLINLYGIKYLNYLKMSDVKLFVLTNFHKEFLLDNGINEDRVIVFPNYLSKAKKKKNINLGDNEYIVYAGRISKEKGLNELISSFLEANEKNYHLKIIGNGPLLKSLKEKYQGSEYSEIEFLGELRNDKVLDIISGSKGVVTSTKLLEGQPMLLCEASIMGIPAIFPKSGGISEFFPKDYKLSFEQFNYEQLESKIKILTSNQNITSKSDVNNQNQENLGDKNKEYIQGYLDKKRLIMLFEECVNG
tara:strand:- start:2222 stop:3451 length:1230 start_codon:yes stop_codon:yes gene_type:complete